jgi:dsDNA-specific endonuclease/ATPase MutS2
MSIQVINDLREKLEALRERRIRAEEGLEAKKREYQQVSEELKSKYGITPPELADKIKELEQAYQKYLAAAEEYLRKIKELGGDSTS